MQITVLHNQNIFDIAIQQCGTVLAALPIALANGLEVTDSLLPGQVLIMPQASPKDQTIQTYYRKKNILPATAAPLLHLNPDHEYFPAFPGMLDLMLS